MASYVIFAFNGNPTCFIHALLNVLDLQEKGHTARLVMEGEAVTLIREMEESGNPLFRQVREQGLLDGVCRACSAKLGVLDYNEASGVPLLGDLKGHPSFASYLDAGYSLITL